MSIPCLALYRVKHTTLDTTRTPHRLIIEPHGDAWAIFPRMQLRPACPARDSRCSLPEADACKRAEGRHQ